MPMPAWLTLVEIFLHAPVYLTFPLCRLSGESHSPHKKACNKITKKEAQVEGDEPEKVVFQ